MGHASNGDHETFAVRSISFIFIVHFLNATGLLREQIMGDLFEINIPYSIIGIVFMINYNYMVKALENRL